MIMDFHNYLLLSTKIGQTRLQCILFLSVNISVDGRACVYMCVCVCVCECLCVACAFRVLLSLCHHINDGDRDAFANIVFSCHSGRNRHNNLCPVPF